MDRTEKVFVAVAGSVAALSLLVVSGCWLVTDDPGAPDVHNPGGKPSGWPVYKETNSVATNAVQEKAVEWPKTW